VGTLIPVPSDGTTKHSIRVKDDLWEAYLKLCTAEGTNCAADIREHIRRRVELQQHQNAEPPASD
jgi:hypothetical protein